MNNKVGIWEIKQSAEPYILEMYIYDDIQGDSYNCWTGEVTESETSANHFREELRKHKDINQINIYINSYGGSVFETVAIYNQLKRHKAHKTVYIDGFACSAASVIAMAGDEIIMPRNTLMMIHNAATSTFGNAEQLRKTADDLDEINDASMEAYLARVNISKDELKTMLDAETWIKAERCVELGFADELSDQEADPEKMKDVIQRANLDIQQRIEIQKSLVAQLQQLNKNKPEQKPAAEEIKAENNIIKFFEALY